MLAHHRQLVLKGMKAQNWRSNLSCKISGIINRLFVPLNLTTYSSHLIRRPVICKCCNSCKVFSRQSNYTFYTKFDRSLIYNYTTQWSLANWQLLLTSTDNNIIIPWDWLAAHYQSPCMLQWHSTMLTLDPSTASFLLVSFIRLYYWDAGEVGTGWKQFWQVVIFLMKQYHK